MTIAISGTNGITLDGQFNSASSMGFKNRIINGAMVIDQRNAGASVSIAGTSQFAVDRFYSACFTASTGATAQQSTTAPNNYINSLKITIGTGQTVASGDVNYVQQKIEGFNIADFGWGTASASTVTLSFWVRSSVTGTFGGALSNSASNRSYPFTYTVLSANTFEQKTITIVGDTSGTWLTNNGVGIQIFWGLGVGSTYSGTANSWAGAQYLSATGATGIVPTSGATFYITGVQLEKGSTATSFDYRPYGTELALCQRYYTKSYDIGVVPGTANPTGNYGLIEGSVGAANSTSLKSVTVVYQVPMRTQGTVTLYDIAGNINKASNDNIGSYTNNQAANIYNGGERSFGAYINNGVSCATLAFFYTASAEL